jgi:elongator complex protein 1
LFQFSEGHREEGIALQRDVGVFEAELKVILEEVWASPTPTQDEGVAENMGAFGSTAMDGWAARMAEKERRAKTNPLDRVNRQDISYALKGWRFPLYDVK